jgi:YD repeat-containing protein
MSSKVLFKICICLAAFIVGMLIARVVPAVEFPTTRFYDARGNLLGSSTTYSRGVTKFYDARGNLTATKTEEEKRRDRR